jgi:3-oxoacyl-[acyl-carrier protein] reductase
MKKIIVTGCSSGIGFYLAENLNKSGYQVIGLARNEPKEKYNFIFEKCDVRNLNSVKSFFSKVKKDTDIYGLLNVAGVATMNLLVTTPEETISNIISTNLTGTIYCTKEIIPCFVKSKTGRIINFSSFAVKIGLQGESVYVASKAGVEGFTRSIARELAPFNVTVNCISPGPIKTKLTNKVPSSYIDKVIQQQIINKQCTKEDIFKSVKLILNLESDKITGENFVIGGF